MENLSLIVVVVILAAVVAGQWILVWRLTDRLLMQARLPSLGPVMTSAPADAPTPVVPQRRRVMSVEVPD